MSTLADAAVRDVFLTRTGRLEPSAARRWGRMSAHEMVCHLNDSFGVAAGRKYASPATGILQRTLLKWLALRTPMPWPHGVPTRPEIEQGAGGTPPVQWEADRDELFRWITEFPDLPKFGTHPVFGAMSRAEWMIWGYRHVDHHFRQFGV